MTGTVYGGRKMDKKGNRAGKIFAVMVLAVLGLMFTAIGVRAAAKNVLVDRLGMDNAFTKLVFMDNPVLNDAEGEHSGHSVHVDWKALYPATRWDAEEAVSGAAGKVNSLKAVKLVGKYKNKIDGIEKAAEYYSTKFLPLYSRITELTAGYEELLHWNYVCYGEYNSITVLDDGYLFHLVEKHGPEYYEENAQTWGQLSAWCRDRGMDFVYVQQPTKIDEFADPESGTTDFSNQNANVLLGLLAERNVDIHDHRTDIRNSGIRLRDMFYVTDHHWKAETGLWASQRLLECMKDDYGYDVEPELLDSSNFDAVVYHEWFLGSEGKKLTLAKCEPEDISLLYPRFDTDLHLTIPNLELDETGPFEITYDMSCIEEKDYYNLNPYAAYDWADCPLISIENLKADNDVRILFIHNSFANVEIPFMALAVQKLDALDLRYFDGSVYSFIEETRPDMVIVAF